ncbi:SIR2 family NAD-dependent protein deacylase [Desulfonema magnum]|uniref:protein acetyllysine N-acetyltransferase n=1 Tax=Desulfonema magnum TaxID=45655 RepID=A0A975BEN0_9BACT|nr:Sir2 family NAD-dependent protein deacetylase [Desulfonema magnum]QTA84031.1 Sirtuin family NAD-dependent deacetylase [Desulfonema magnum]
MNQDIKTLLRDVVRNSGHITVLTGAGISAESGIPTFRGPEGYWSVGSKEYHPQEMATYSMFMQNPDEIWKWYLYRLGICQSAEPNPGHLALVEMENRFKDHFTLITQNVDGLHLRAGNSLENTFQIHGNINYMRCSHECSDDVFPIPEEVSGKAKGEELTETDRKLLTCPNCGKRTRPHVLWFDETYNEHFYHYSSSLKAAQKTALLIVAGTSGATNLPNQVAWEVYRREGIIVDVNIQENPFSNMALSSTKGYFMKEACSTALPAVLEALSG